MIDTEVDKQAYNEQVLNNVDRMDLLMIFKLYQSLVHDLKEQLKKEGLIPDISVTDDES